MLILRLIEQDVTEPRCLGETGGEVHVARGQRERGREAPSREMFDTQANGDGPIIAGDVNEVADRLAAIHASLKHDRHILHFDIGNIEHNAVMKAIELFGTKVLPQVQSL